MEIDEKPRCGSLEGCRESGISGSGVELSLGDEKSRKPTRGESLVRVSSEDSRGGTTSLSSSNNEENKTTERSENEEGRNLVSAKGKVSEAKKRKAEGNPLASDDKENERELTENDDNENASANHENIEKSTNDDVPKKMAILGRKHEDSRKTQKKSTPITTASQVVKYRKLKPTNPKPFKLRTDERGILKEANLDRKIPSPSKETTVKGGGKAIRQHQNVNRKSETCSTKSEQDTDYYSSCDEKSCQTTPENQSGSIQIDTSNCKVQQRKLSAHRNTPGPKLQKPIDVDGNFTRKPEMMQRKVLRPLSVLPRKKEKVFIATKLSVIIERPSDNVKPKELKPRKNEADRPCSLSRGRRALTVPKEPKFQSLHVPKGCIPRKHT